MFDPIAWLAHAPYGVRVFLGIMLLFWAIATTFTAALRAVPEERYNALERASPRLGHFFRALRKWGTDVVAFVRELVRAFVGNWRQPPPLPLLLVAIGLGVSLQACRLPPRDGCIPASTRCSPAGIPETCSGTERWYHLTTAQPCTEIGGVCCRTRSEYGNTLYACAQPSRCLPETAQDGGVSHD